jgi:hypothetical protein
MNSPKLGRRQWNGGERTEEDQISQQCRREEVAAASSTGMPGVIEHRRRRGAGRRWRSFAVPRSGDEAQEAEEQRKKKALWG